MKTIIRIILLVSFFYSAKAQNPNQALNFDGVDDYVSLNANVNFTSNSYTIEFWIKRDVNSDGYIYGMGNTFAANKYMHIGWVTASVLRFGFIANNLDANVGNDGLWHHYAFTYNSATPSGSHNRFIYKDGVVVASDEAAPYTGASNTEIGSASLLGNNEYYKGSMDRLAISLGAKTAQQLNEQKFCETSTVGLVSLYDFQDNPNGTILSTLDNNPIYFGTLNNFALSGTTSNWVSETAYEISHFSAPMPDQQVVEGGSFTLDANFVVGDCTLGNVIQWTKDGQVIPDEDDPIISVSSLTSADYGVYQLQVSYNGGSILSNPVNITPGVDFTASQGTSDYFTDVTWTLPITPCLLDDNQDPYGYVTVQLMGDGSQIDFQTFDMAALSALYANDEPIIGAYRDFIGPNATKTYTINVFVGLLGGTDAECFGLTAQGSTLPLQNPELSIAPGFSDITIGIKNKSDAASSYEIYRDNGLIHTITDPGAAELDSLVEYQDAYVFDNVTSIKSGQSYQYEVKMISSLINEINDYDLGMASTLDPNVSHIAAPTNTEKVDFQWSDQFADNYDEIEIRRENRRIAVQLNSSSAYSDFNPFFGDSTDYQFRFIKSDTVRADFTNKTFLEGNGVIAGRVITQEGLFPVDAVKVFIKRKSTGDIDSVVTDPGGQFSFAGISYGLLDSFDISAQKENHTFVYPVETFGLSSRVREVSDAVIIDNFKYLQGTTTHTVSSFTATPTINEDEVVLHWSLSTNAPTIFIDLIRNGDIIYSSTDLADLTGSFVDRGGIPGEDTKYDIRLYTISGSTVSSNQSTQEIVFPEVSAVPIAEFSAIEESISSFNGGSMSTTGNVLLSWLHSSTNFDKFRIYRNSQIIAELDNTVTAYIDKTAPFDSTLSYSITVIRRLNETTYETKTPTIANAISRSAMPAPPNISAFQQSSDPSILINWAPPSEVFNGFDYTGFFIYRNDELIATRYGATSNFVFDKRGFGKTGIVYSVSLFKHTAEGIVESERSEAAPVDFPATADVPDFLSPLLEIDGPNSIKLRWERNANLSPNISYYLLKHEDNVIARLPPYEGNFTHFPASGFDQEYKLHVVNLVDSTEYISSNFSTINVNYGPTGGNVYAPQNFKASRNLPGQIKLCWEYLDFIPSQFIIYRNDEPIDTLPVGARSYFDYTNSEQNVNFVYSIRAFQGSNFSTYVGDYGTRSEQRLIYGTVTDAGTNNGIADVEIEIDYLGRKVLATYTDSTGYYSFLSPQSYADFNPTIVAIRNGQRFTPSSSVAAENALRVDFESNILDRPVIEGQGTSEYADHYINPYTLDSDISWRITNEDYDGVEVYRGFDLLAKVPIADGNIYTDTTAVPGIEYPYFVRTYKNGINGLTFSSNDSVMITYPPIAPVIHLSATPQPNSNQVLVQWSHLYEHADGYQISVNGDPQYIVLADSMFLFYDSLGIAGQEYTYQVEAFKVINGIPYFSVPKEVTAIYPSAAPVQDLVISIPAPTGVFAPLITLNHVRLDWNYEGSSVERYNIFRNDELIATLPQGSTSYEDHDGIPLSSVTYGVSAIVNQFGNKNESQRIMADTIYPQISEPVPPGGLGSEAGALLLFWNYYAPAVEKFVIRAVSDGGQSVRILEYTDEIFTNQEQSHLLIDRDGIPGQSVEYSVAAASVRDGVEYLSPFTLIDFDIYPYPLAPNVSASDEVYDKAIDVSWTIDADSGVDSFRLRRYDNANGIWVELGNVGPEERSYFDQFAPTDEVAPNYIYYVATCKIIDGVLNCYEQSEGSDNGSLKLPTPDTEIVGDPNSSFGASVDIHQDWMVVGDPDLRKVTIYQFINDEWVESFMLPSSFDGFGYSVAIWDDFLVVGAPFYSVDNGPQIGLVSTYQRNANGIWVSIQSIDTNNTGFRFGRSVDVEGDIIVVASDGLSGTVGDQISSTFTVYKNVNGLIDQLTVDPTPTTFPYNNWTSATGSRQVHIEGNDIFMNTLNVTESGNPDGLVLHYKLNSGQTNAEFQSGFTDPNSFFGLALDVDNGKLAVASLLPTTFQGITHLYTYNGTSWIIDESLTDPTNQSNFSASIDLKGDLLAISNRDHPNIGVSQKVYLYREIAGSYNLIQSPNPTDANFRSDFFNTDADRQGYGNEIALTDDQIIISDSRGFSPINPTLYFFDIYTPEVLTLTATEGTLLYTRLDWTSECPDCPNDYIDHFNVYRDSELIAEVDGTLDQFQDNPVNLLTGATQAKEGQIYTYEVSAVSGISRESTGISAQGYSKREGLIKGNVYVIGTNSGVPGVTIEAVGVDPLTTTPYSYSTTSLSDGSFTLSGLFVTEGSIDYQIIPSFGTNELEVFGSDIVPLSIGAPEEEQVIINDKTAFVIAGHATNNITNCGIEGVKVVYYHTINNVESAVDSTFTDRDGMYSILVKPTLPNLQQIKIEISELKITSNAQGGNDTIRCEFLSPVSTYSNFANFPMSSTLDFEESLVYPLSIFVQNACQNPVADQPIAMRISSIDGCLEMTAQTDNNGQLYIDLPPNDYLFAVESLVGSGVTNYENSAIDYLKLRQYNFDLLSIHEEAGGADTLPTVDPILFEYHRATSFVLSTSFDRYKCNDPMQPAIITQGDSHSMDITITEDHMVGETCEVYGGYIRVLNPAASGKIVDTLESTGGAFPSYSFTVGAPNLVSPYTYGISFQYFSEDDNLLGQRVISVIAEGQRQLPGTGIITESTRDEAGNLQFPLLVLRDPPGDGSFSSIASGATINKSISFSSENKGSIGFHLESEFSVFKLGGFLNLDVGLGGGIAKSSSFDINFQTDQTYSTSSSEDAVGRGADVIVGSGLSQQYGLSRSLFFENDNCDAKSETTYSFGIGGFQSTYSYTIDFIENLIETYTRDSILIEMGDLVYTRPSGDDYTVDESRERVSALISTWKEMIHYHDVETVPHYVLCSDFGYKKDELSAEAIALYSDWQNSFCTLIGDYNGEEFIMDEQIEWTPTLINAYNNTVAYTDKLKDPLTDIAQGDLGVADLNIESGSLGITNAYHALLGNQLKSADVYDISGNVQFEKSITAQQSSTTSQDLSSFFYLETAFGVNTDAEEEIGFGLITSAATAKAKAGVKITTNASIGISHAQAQSNSSTITYSIFDNDAEDQITFIALQASLQDHTPYFIRLGGLSSCPPEEKLTVGQDNDPLLIDDFQMEVVIDPETGATTPQPNPSFNVDPDEAEVFQVKISNEGPTNQVRDAEVFLDLASNPTGAIIKIGGSNLNIVSPVFSVPAGGSLTQFLTVERPPNTEFYNFKDLRIGIRPACGGEAEYIDLSVFFKSPCSDVSLTMPLDYYVLNRISPNVSDDSEVIPFEIRDYDSSDSSNLEYVQLQYRRLGNNSGWQNVPRDEGNFTKQELFLDDSGDSPGVDPAFFNEWDVTGLYNLIPDGDYLLRAQAYCGTSGINVSNEVNMDVRRSAFIITGYPEPADGIWSDGANGADEISTTFSTDIDCGILNTTDSIEQYLSLYTLPSMMEVPFAYICQNDKVTLIPSVDIATLDGEMVRATYKGIFNLAGNTAEEVVWDFKVVTTAVDWNDDMIELTLYQDELSTVSTAIFNTTGTPVGGLSISGATNLSWLSIDPSGSFTVGSGGDGVNLNFNLGGDLPTGEYTTSLMINGLDGGRIPELPITLNIIERPPFPDINASFTDSMQMVLNWAFSHDNVKSTDIQDAIFVYNDGQLVGGGNITVEGNFYFAKIKVYGNNNGDLLDFVVWDADQQLAYSAISSSSIPFEANSSSVGLISDPKVILVNDDLFEIAKRIYVDQASNVANPDGRSWQTAFPELQDGITVAFAGDEIWIAEGTYRPTTGGDASISYTITEAISVYGGFVNGMDDLEDRTGNNETVLSGDLLIQGAITDNSYHVVESSSTNLHLDMISIVDGNARAVGTDDRGGCFYNTGNVTLKDCKMSGGNAVDQGTLIYNSGQMIIDGGVFTLPIVPTVSNLYNDSGGMVTIRQNVSFMK